MSIYKKAYETSVRAAEEGFDWESWEGAYHKVAEELEEVRQEVLLSPCGSHAALVEEFGDLIFSIMSLARHLKIDPEEACEVGLEKFDKRYKGFKTLAKQKGIDMRASSEAALYQLWLEYKKTLKAGAIGED